MHFFVFRCTEDCIVLVCCGLYDLLRGVLVILPDVMLEDVMDKLIQPDYLIVLVNHPSPLIQQGVIKVSQYKMCSTKKLSASCELTLSET